MRTDTLPFSTDDARWAAVRARDRAADGHFVYAVRTTGTYAPPSAAARAPRRENVLFFDSARDAEAAGFRPSRHAHADRGAQDARRAALVAQACRAIEAGEDIPRLDALAASAGLSRFHFHRLFKAATGVTPRAYADAQRAARLRDGLAGAARITDAIYDAGFASSGRFYAQSDARLGMRPTRFRARGAAESIRFAVGQCSLGAILVAQSARGICAIALGDDPEALVRELQDQFGNAELSAGDAGFDALVARVVGFVEHPTLALDLPLDVRGTAFQERVWQALRDIPPGTTLSYTELAARIGAPSATRAVASACAANRIAIAIPCHRVVRRDGDPSGYRWGVERKKALIAREGGTDGRLRARREVGSPLSRG